MPLPSTILTRCLLAGAALAFAAPPSFAVGLPLVITEVMSSGASNDWFELTNFGSITLSLTNFKMDDNSFALGTAVSLTGITNIAPGESVVFIETSTGTPATEVTNFRNFWGGPVLTMQLGSYAGSGAGVGLSSSGDGVIVFDSTGTEVTRVSFGAATTNVSFGYNPALAPGQSGFTGAASSLGTNGAYNSVGAPTNVGSLGTIPEPGSALLLTIGAAVLLQRPRRNVASR